LPQGIRQTRTSVKRVLDTSVGRVVLDFYGDSVVSVVLLDEHGWEKQEGEWGDRQIAKALFYNAGVPEDEAHAIEAQILSEYEARGGKPVGEWENGDRITNAIIGSIVLTWFGAFLVGLGTIARFLWNRGR
jgi:hypothetical protein